jgi:hypothetical protein
VALSVLLVLAEVFTRRFFSGPRTAKQKRVVTRVSAPRPVAEAATPVPEPSPAAPVSPEAPPPAPVPEKKPDGVASALAAAREKSKRRTGR